MNWGYKIILVYAVFVTGIIYMVVKSSSQNIDLVTNNYYEEELQYQQTIDATKRANGLSAKVKCTIVNDTMRIVFPDEMKRNPVTAGIWLYCIADKNKDVKIEREVLNGLVLLPLPVINKGLHDIKINWEADAETYYYEQKIFIQ